MEIDDPLRLDRQVCFALAVANRAVLAVYRPLLEPLGLTHPQYLVMLALWGDAPMSVKSIAEAVQLDSPTLSPLLKRLETAGLVRRERSARDERSVEVRVTEKGLALREQALQVPRRIVAATSFDVDEIRVLRARLDELTIALDAAALEA